MRPRTALIAVVALALAAPAPAMAAKKKKSAPIPKACLLMTDQTGDGDWNNAPIVKTDSLDIVSGDIATGKGQLVAVLRLVSTNSASENYSKLGFSWKMGASANGTRYEFGVRRGAGLNPVESTSVNIGDQNAVPHDFKVVGNTFVWTVKRSDVKAMARPGLVWTDFGANSNVLSGTADTAGSEKRYADRTPSCVPAL